MRCERAQQWMVEALEATLSPRRRRALDDHLVRCASCRAELAATERLFGALDALPMEAPVPVRLEQATLRSVRLLAAEEEERRVARAQRFPWFRLAVPALAAAATVAVALVATLTSGPEPQRTGSGPAATAAKPGPARVAKAAPRSTLEPSARVIAAAKPSPHEARPEVASAAPSGLPVELTQAPDLLFALPMLHNLDKLEHFEKIQTTVLDDDIGQPPGDADSNG